ncbi:DUF2934 domain-containing protein [Neorhizobium alkalisoli]|uniref:DUF2934 family protein n=1 Tax=Neorhizobium alkalisoli TaxID=528178 RepID=A0A561PVU2_9HYPH|nr:DUF2934 domain-containing protein [Neorhizobium alkalisoli]TWF42234.1 DUF2934 family protein [Neorhizobium alkalisoli]
MSIDRDEWISQRAFAIWEEQGRPHGFDGEHWAQANMEWEERDGPLEGARVELTPEGESFSGSTPFRRAI